MEHDNSGLEQVITHTEQALCTLYGDPNLANKDSAHRWLLEVQNLPQAWQVCWRLMQHNKAPEVQFFGASLLHYKITKYWCELPENQYEQLKSEIIRYVILFYNGAKVVLTRLCIAMAAFAIQTMPHHWQNVVRDIVRIFEEASISQHIDLRPVVLEVVTVLPEEFNSSDFMSTRRAELRHELQSSAPAIIEILNNAFAAEIAIKLQGLRCVISWTQFGLTLADIDKLGSYCITSCLEDDDLFDVAVDALVEITTSPSSYREPSYVKKYIARAVEKAETFRSALLSDMDKAVGVCRFLVSLGETHCKMFLTPNTQEERGLYAQFVRLILDYTNCPGFYPADELCSEMTFTFWYTFQDEIVSAEPALSAQCKQEFGPFYIGLTRVLLKKAQYPPDPEWSGYSADEKEQFRCYRQDVSDTMMYIYCLLREQSLQILHHDLSAALSCPSQTVWQMIESTLYLIQAVGVYVDPSEDTYLPAILALFSKFPSHTKISHTALLMIGSYCDWLKCHPVFLKSVIPVLLDNMTDKTLVSPATQALRDICQECAHDLDRESLMLIVNHCQVALSSGKLKDREQIRCMECLGHTLSVQPLVDIVNSLETIIAPHIVFLAELASKEPFKTLKPKVNVEVQLFTILFKTLDPDDIGDKQHPVLLVLEKVFSSLCQTGKTWIEDADIIQAICLCLERAIDTIRDGMGALVQNLAELIIDLYTKCPRSCLLDTSVLILGMYAKESQHQKVIFGFFEKMALMTLDVLQKDFVNNPDIIQSFMHFLSRALRSNPYIVFGNNDLHKNCFQCGLSSLNRPESHTVKACCGFFVAYIKCFESQEKVREMLSSSGHQLVNQILQGVGGRIPRQNMDSLADILLALNSNCLTLLSTWLQDLLHIEDFPSKLVTLKEKQQFRSSVLRERVHKRRLKEIVKEFSLLCRGIYNTAYGAA